jgi:hypothetical protein
MPIPKTLRRSGLQIRVLLIAEIFAFGMLIGFPKSHAGVFTLPRFVMPGEFAVGVEPEIFFPGGSSTGTNVGINLRYTHGISDTSNLTILGGTGSGPRGLRAGGALTFDVFPDSESQPGIGIALQGLFIQLPTAGSVEVSSIPYLHKSFSSGAGGSVIEPFLAVPLGLSLSQGAYQTLSTLSLGAIFQHNDHFRSVVEIGFGMSNTAGYLSGGVSYYH